MPLPETKKGGKRMRESRMSPIGANAYGIYIDKVTGGEVRGRIAGPGAPADSAFTSLSKMILLLDEYLSAEFQEKPAAVPARKADFELEILFRQNYSWQGRLRWPSGGKEATFRSVLELIFILETILPQLEK